MPGRILSKERFAGGLTAACCSLLVLSAPVYAHDVTPKPGETPAQAEAEHLHEHEIIGYWESKILKMSAAQKAALRSRALQQPSAKKGSSKKAKRLQDQAVGPASVYGAWTAGPFKAPTFGIHVVMLPTGRVLMMSMGDSSGAGLPGGSDGQDVNNDGNAAVWDPSRGTGPDSFKILPPPPITLDDPQRRKGYNKLRPAPVYCSGHVQLADGRVLVAGGNLESSGGGYGLKISFLFDPWTETWVRQPDLVKARWYPTLVRLANGKVAIIAGQDENAINRPEIEVYPAEGQPVPGIDTSDEVIAGTTVKTNRNIPSFYPLSYVLPDGRLAIVGPTQGDQGIVDTNTWAWTNTVGYRAAGNAYPSYFPAPGTVDGPDRVYVTGGLSVRGYLQPLVSSIRPGIDARWTDQPALQLSRRNAPSVLLPDGTVVTVGGGEKVLRDVDPANLWPTRRQPELWDPVTHKWRLGPAEQRPRGYHSTAVLLPDGRVMSTGDDLDSVLFDDNTKDQYPTTIELYSPPYLFKGPRPVIESAPERASYDQPFTFTVDGNAAAVDRVTVVAPGSNTHAMDMNQRQLELRIVGRTNNTITVLAPPTSGAAPPGDYMLFALSTAGVPSVAKFISFLPPGAPGHPAAASAPDWGTPTPTPTPLGTPVPTLVPTPTAAPTPTPKPTAMPAPTPKPTAVPTPTPAPVTKAPRPWWWPWFLPWNG